MNKIIKLSLIIMIFTIFSLPTFAIENVVENHSQNLTEFSDFTGETFFKSKYEIDEERQKNLQQMKRKYYRRFLVNEGDSTFNYSNRKSMPPLKKLRLGVVRLKDKVSASRTAKKAAKEAAKNAETGNDISEEALQVEDKSEVIENEVIAEEAETAQTMIKCKTMKYLPETNEMEATGNVEIKFPQQDIYLYADRMTYDTVNSIIQLYDNVKVIRQGNEVLGEYIKVDLNNETGFLKNLKASEYNIDIIAENGYMFGDTIVAENGKITSNMDNLLELRSSGFGEDLKRFIIPKEDMSFLLNDAGNSRYTVKVNEIKINAKAAHDKISLKNPKVYSNKTGKKVLALPSLTFYTNKEHDYFEGNYPELGSYAGFGMFAGPGVVLETPYGSTLKLIPTVSYKKKIGFGGIARFKSGTNQTDVGYNTAAQRFLLKGYQRLDDHLYLQYGANSYMDSWFMGQSWLGYGGELLFEKGYTHKDFLFNKANANFRHRISAGMFRENARGNDNEYFNGYHKMGTARFKYMAEYNQKLYSMFGDEDTTNNKGWKQLDLRLISQGSAALYGTGDTQFVGRIGPRIDSQYKFWRQELGYYFTGYSDNTPLVSFDAYRYGHSNIYVREYLRLHKFLTLGLYGSYNLSDDIYDYQYKKQSRLREATVYASLGPDDLKLNLGYDFIRQNTYFGVSVAMNTKGSSVEYKKIEMKNFDEFGKVKGEQNKVEKFEFSPPPSPYKSKAVVENLEDSTTYMKGELL